MKHYTAKNKLTGSLQSTSQFVHLSYSTGFTSSELKLKDN